MTGWASRFAAWLGLRQPMTDAAPVEAVEPVDDVQDAAEFVKPAVEASPPDVEPEPELAPEPSGEAGPVDALPPGLLLLRALYQTATEEQRSWLAASEPAALEHWMVNAEAVVLADQPQLLMQALDYVRVAQAHAEAAQQQQELFAANGRALMGLLTNPVLRQRAIAAYQLERAGAGGNGRGGWPAATGSLRGW